ncbi:hypothetical protein CsatA_014127 [Cannabis sativa]
MLKFGPNIDTSTNPTVFLKVPNDGGATWKFKLTKSEDGRTWLKKGWADFAIHYILLKSEDYTLSFIYHENQSTFLVGILDANGIEISYPVTSNIDHQQELSKRPEEEEKEGADQDHNNPSSSTSPLPSLRPRRNEQGQQLNRKDSTFLLEPAKKTEKTKWHLKLHISSQATPPRAWFDKREWQEFIENNDLKIEDVLIFELIEKTEEIIVFNIIIHRVTQQSQQLQSHQEVEGNNMISETNSKDDTSCHASKDKPSSSKDGQFFGEGTEQCCYPSFEVKLGESIDEVQQIPNDFVRKHFEEKPEAVKIQDKEKKFWEADLRWSSDQVILCAGWS